MSSKLNGDVALGPRGLVSRCPKREGRSTELRARGDDGSPLPWGRSPPCRLTTRAVWTRTPCGQADLNEGGPRAQLRGSAALSHLLAESLLECEGREESGSPAPGKALMQRPVRRARWLPLGAGTPAARRSHPPLLPKWWEDSRLRGARLDYISRHPLQRGQSCDQVQPRDPEQQ